MKVTIDTTNKVIEVSEPVTYGLLTETLERFIPNRAELAEYVIRFEPVYIDRGIPYYEYPLNEIPFKITCTGTR